MTVLIDTNVAVAVLRGRSHPVRDRFRSAIAAGEELWISSISLFELWYGVARSSHAAANAQRLRTFLAGPINVAGFTTADAVRAGDIRHALAGNGTPIGPYDLLIAAQAVRMDATLVTGNISEFERVEGLTVESWSAVP